MRCCVMLSAMTPCTCRSRPSAGPWPARPGRRPRRRSWRGRPGPARPGPAAGRRRAYSVLRSVPNIGGSSLLMVTSTPAVDHLLERVLVQGAHRAGGDVGGGADLQRDAVLGEVGQQLRVLGGAGAVADALGAQVGERVPDRLRARWSRPACGTECRPAAMARSKYGLNCGRGTPISGPPSPNETRPSGGRSHGDPGGLLGGLQARLAGDVEAPAQHHAQLGLRRLAGVLDGLDERGVGDAAAGRAEGGDGQLGVADVAAGPCPGRPRTSAAGRPRRCGSGPRRRGRPR